MLDKISLEATRKILNHYFLIGGEPAGDKMSDGQIDIFAAIFYKLKPRAATLAPTGYGKSESVSMAVALRAHLYQDDFIIGSVKYGTSEIIMKNVIEHLFDNADIVSNLEIDSTQHLTRLKRERNKNAINFKDGGSIKIVSLHGADDDVSRAIGEHVPNIILDESPLLSPTKYLIILKILEGTGDYNKTFLFELGNAVNRNHFMFNIKSNDKYLKLDISLEQALREGRLDQESVDEKRGLPFFEQFYECKFPSEDEIDAKGYRQLLTTEEIDASSVGAFDPDDTTPMKLGVDVGGGGDYNVFTIRQSNRAWVEAHNRSNDTMTNVTEVTRIIEKYTVNGIRLLKPEEVYIDDIGIGRGVTDRLKEMGYNVNGVSVGEVAQDKSRFKNIKAENYWLARMWFKEGGKILKQNEWYQMVWIKYKISTDKVLQIEPKEDLKSRTGKSPDYAESFSLTLRLYNRLCKW